MTQSIMIVDDSRAIQAIIKRTIDAGGYGAATIHAVSSGHAALAAVESLCPDLVITDWHMPGMSGLELLQTLRQVRGQQIKVGLVTTEMCPDLLRQARDNGAEFILHKPFADAELLDSIRRAVGPPGGAAPAPASAGTASAASAISSAGAATDPVPATDTANPSTGSSTAQARASAALTKVLAKTLGPIKFRLVDLAPPPLNQLSSKLLLGLYSLGTTHSAHALGLVDLASVCMLGGGAMGYQPSQVRPAIAAASATQLMVEHATAFMREAAVALAQEGGEVPVMSRGTMVSRELGKLQDALQRSQLTLGFKLSVPGYGEGRLIFVLL